MVLRFVSITRSPSLLTISHDNHLVIPFGTPLRQQVSSSHTKRRLFNVVSVDKAHSLNEHLAERRICLASSTAPPTQTLSILPNNDSGPANDHNTATNGTFQTPPTHHQRFIESKRRYQANISLEMRQKKVERQRQRQREQTPEQRKNENQERRRRYALNSVSIAIEPDNEQAVRRRPILHSGRDSANRPTTHFLGEMSIQCPHCHAKHFEAAKKSRGHFSTCSSGGSIEISTRPAYPDQLKEWLTGSSLDSKHFRTFVRNYNNAFAFVSFGYNPVKFPAGPQVVVIQGQVYHKTITGIGQSKTYADLYILDPAEANQLRLNNENNLGCRDDFVERIQQILYEYNAFALAFISMKDVIARTDPDVNIFYLSKMIGSKIRDDLIYQPITK